MSLPQLMAVSKEEQSSYEVAVNYFNKQAKLKPISTTDKEYSYDLVPKQDEKKGLWGFVDSREKWIMKPVFDEVNNFEKDNCAIVKFNGYWGVIDRTQTFCIVPICSNIQRSAADGIFIARCPDLLLDEYEAKTYNKKRDSDLLPKVDSSIAKSLFIKKDGTFLNADKYNTICDFDADKLSIVSTSKGYGLLKNDGKYVYEPRFAEMSKYASGLYKVKEGKDYGIVSKDGHFVLSPSFDIIEPWSSTNLIWVRRSSSMQWGAIDSKGISIVSTQLDNKPNFTLSSVQIVTSNGKYGILREDGLFLSQCKDEYIEQDGDRFWVMRKTGHYGYYTINDKDVSYVELPHLSNVSEGKGAMSKYRSRYTSNMESRLWLRGLKQATFYSVLLDEKESSFLFEAQGQEYELQIQWEDTVSLHLTNLETKRSWSLNFKRTVGIFNLDNEGQRREMFTNEYVFGTCDFNRNGNDDLVIAMRDNSTEGYEKPSGGCYGVLKIAANGDLSWYNSGRFSEDPVGSANISVGSIKATVAESSASSNYPRVENFGLQGPVMTTGDFSFNYDGYLTAIGKYHITYGSDNIPRLIGNYGTEDFTRNYRITKFDQKAIVVSFEIDCSGSGYYQEESESWYFNSQGLLELYQPFSCNGGGQFYYIYDEKGRLRYEIESHTMGSIKDFQPHTALLDLFGNWTEQEVIEYDRVNNPTKKTIKRTIEYYTESESGK